MKVTAILVTSLLVLGLPMAALGQATESGQISVLVQNQAITLVEDAALSFGTILPYGRPGFIRINTNGSASVNAVHQSAPGQAAQWSVTGVPNAPFDITLPANGTVTVNSGSFSMDVDTFGHNQGSQPVLDGAGERVFLVGATLRVGANQPAGTYTGTYNVTVTYN